MDAERAHTELIQPIALHRVGTHEAAVATVALASVRAYLDHPEHPGWADWLAGRFGKSVRRARAAQFDAITTDALSVQTLPGGTAAAFAPTTYETMDPRLRKMQVAGTDMERTGVWLTCENGPRITVNDALGMSTGKTAAQVAHGLFAWALRQERATLTEWIAADAPLTLRAVPADTFHKAVPGATVRINDSGLTEIAPGSATVLVHS